MSIESRLKRGDSVEDIKKIFPDSHAEIDAILASTNKPKKKSAKKKASNKSTG